MTIHPSRWGSLVYTAAGLGTAAAGEAVLDDVGATWPTILVVVGLYVAASGIRRLYP